MPDLLLELFSEEIPARMQRRAAEDLRRLVTDALVERGFLYEGARALATPRRLALHVAGLPAKGKDVREERRGPRVGAPEGALQGFLKGAGLSSIDQARVEKDPKKGEFYVAVIERPGRPTPEVLAEILPAIVRAFPWPKSMRWGAASRDPGSLRWVRPLHSILCTFGPETEEPEVVPFEVDGIRSADVTRGHRFLALDPLRVRRLDDYVSALEAAKVVVDPDRRRDIIRHEAQNLAFARGLELVEDEALLEEVAGLVEWPVPLVGSFDATFLAIPPEVIRATIRANQKCFVLRAPSSPQGREGLGVEKSERESADPSLGAGTAAHSSAGSSTVPTPTPNPSPQGGGESGGALSNSFILVSNLEASDGGRKIVAGNERVVRARLSDAKFFWETDQKPLPEFSDRPDLKPLDQRLERLKALNIVFHEKLGTQGERVERIAALAKQLAPLVGADPDLAERAARLAKADLVTEMVGEFPELQGLMGRYYATAQGEHPSVAAAIEEHYKPLGPSDRVPTDPVSVAVALADKIDTLVGFWAIDEKPTGSKDPYALRRAALGVIRLVLENGLRIALTNSAVLAGRLVMAGQLRRAAGQKVSTHLSSVAALGRLDELRKMLDVSETAAQLMASERSREVAPQAWELARSSDLLSFFADRLKVYLREKGARHDLIDAVFSAGAHGRHAEERPQAASRSTPSVSAGMQDRGPSFETQASPAPQDDERGSGAEAAPQDDLLMIVRRVEALGRFLDTEDGKNLLAGFKRAANILRIEEKKDGRSYDGEPDRHLVQERGLPEERVLFEVLEAASGQARDHIAREDFEGAMRALAELRPAVDAFFDKVTVNAEDPAMRENRLKLLNQFRRATREVADFSKIEG